jgi:predicted MFS family arabinose efflux permease
VASAPSLVWLDAASLTHGMTSALAQVLVAFAAQLSPPQRRGRVVGTIQAGILAGILLARTVSGTVSAYLGWRPMFWPAAAVNLGLVIVLHRVLPRIPPVTSLPYLRALWSLKDPCQSYPQLRTSSLMGSATVRRLQRLLVDPCVPSCRTALRLWASSGLTFRAPGRGRRLERSCRRPPH